MQKIMLVESNESMKAILFRELSESNYNVLAFSDNREALEEVFEFHPDLVITNATSLTMSTSEFVVKVKELTHRSVPVLLCTGGDTKSVDFIKPFQEAGVDDILQKPFDFKTLLDTIENLMIGSVSSQIT